MLGLPRGGVPAAFEVARALGAPLDVIVVRKLGVPFQPELAMGAIGEGGVRVDNQEVLRMTAVDSFDVDAVEGRDGAELNRRAEQYRGGRPRLDLEGRCAVIVDDGIATGSTVRAACQVARALGAARIVIAVPVASRQAVVALQEVCDEVLCIEVPEPFYAVESGTAISRRRRTIRLSNSSAVQLPGPRGYPTRASTTLRAVTRMC